MPNAIIAALVLGVTTL